MIDKDATPILSIENISKKYFYTNRNKQSKAGNSKENSFWALKDISLQLKKGDTLGIIGANGSGKTTLLKILSQATAPSAGKVIQYGKLIPIIDIGSGFHPDLSGRENIFLYGTVMLGMEKSEIQTNLNEIIDFSELGNFIDEPIKNYSNGMYLRLALSVALFCKLDILLLDEIFSVGDSAFMLKSYDKMNQIIKQAATVILASHSMDDIMRICNKCLWLDKGEIKMMGNASDVVAAYLQSNDYLLNSTSMLQSFVLQAEKKWSAVDAPQADQFRLISVSIRSEGKELPHTALNYNYPISIQIICDKITEDCEIGFSLILADHYNVPLLITNIFFEEEENTNLYGNKGTFKYTCTIPHKLFNIGIYKINLEVSLNKSRLLYVSDVLTFKIISEITEQAVILKRHPIKIVPTLPWQITQWK